MIERLPCGLLTPSVGPEWTTQPVSPVTARPRSVGVVILNAVDCSYACLAPATRLQQSGQATAHWRAEIFRLPGSTAAIPPFCRAVKPQ